MISKKVSKICSHLWWKRIYILAVFRHFACTVLHSTDDCELNFEFLLFYCITERFSSYKKKLASVYSTEILIAMYHFLRVFQCCQVSCDIFLKTNLLVEYLVISLSFILLCWKLNDFYKCLCNGRLLMHILWTPKALFYRCTRIVEHKFCSLTCMYFYL